MVYRIDGNGFFRKQYVVSPDKVYSLLERCTDFGWYQLDLDVGMHQLTIPFDFSTVHVGKQLEKQRISDKWWDEMIEEAEKRDIPTSYVNRNP